jgi:hypothetical protein
MSLLSVIARLPGGARDIGARCETSMPFGVVVVVAQSRGRGRRPRQLKMYTGVVGGLLELQADGRGCGDSLVIASASESVRSAVWRPRAWLAWMRAHRVRPVAMRPRRARSSRADVAVEVRRRGRRSGRRGVDVGHCGATGCRVDSGRCGVHGGLDPWRQREDGLDRALGLLGLLRGRDGQHAHGVPEVRDDRGQRVDVLGHRLIRLALDVRLLEQRGAQFHGVGRGGSALCRRWARTWASWSACAWLAWASSARCSARRRAAAPWCGLRRPRSGRAARRGAR